MVEPGEQSKRVMGNEHPQNSVAYLVMLFQASTRVEDEEEGPHDDRPKSHSPPA